MSQSESTAVPSLAQSAAALAAHEVERAGTELKSDLKHTSVMAVGMSVGATLGLCGVNLLLLAAADLAAQRLPRWTARGLVGLGVMALGAAAGAFGWRRRIRQPLWRTRAKMRSQVQRALEVP